MDNVRSVPPEILRRNNIREATSGLQFALLRNELPDPNIELAHQPNAVQSFLHFFPNSPPELRLAIWRWMIPRRTLDLECLAYCYGSRRRYCPSLRVPEVLQVSKDSRGETLKHYSIVWDHKEVPQEDFWNSNEYQKRTASAGCFFFSPVFDTLSIRSSDMGWDYRWIGNTKAREEALARIDYFRTIELPIHWTYTYLDLTPVHVRDLDWLLRFSQLEEIYMGQRWESDTHDRRYFHSRHREKNPYEDKLLCWTKDLTNFLNDHADLFPKGIPPKVVMGKPLLTFSTHIRKSAISGCTNGNSSLLRGKAGRVRISGLKSCNLIND